MNSSKRILFTGGSGKAGKHVVKYLISQGYKVLNCDLVNYPQENLDYICLDITDSGQVFNVLSSHFNYDELRTKEKPTKIEAVVHFAAIPRLLHKPDNETYRINVLGTYNILEASIKLGVKKIIFASSETVYGYCFSHGNPKPSSLPVTEDDPLKPMDSYAISKVVNEETAKGFQRRSGIDMYCLRIGNVIEPNEASLFEKFCENPEIRLPNVFNYIDARDLGQAVELCLQKDGLGYEVFNVSNDNNSVNLTSEQILHQFYKKANLKFTLGKNECLFSNRKIKSILGFEPKNNWQMK
ncbi:MAG: NAD(P)-dependent oxidoreductase [Pseudomonadota bacterium]|nr:NAD(P)-dependent oxidoreductase [Pseudomonadota bacterium]